MNTPQGKAHCLVLAMVLGVGLSLTGCHSGGGTDGGFTTNGGGGATPNLVLFAEDQPSGNVLSFELTLSSITMSTGTGSPVTVLPSTEAVALEWRHLGLAPTVLQTASIAAGTYTTMTVTVVSPRATVFDPIGGSFPATNLAACSGASFSVTIPINVTIASNTLTGLRLDLNLRDSIELDAMNNLCLRPMFNVVPTSFTPGELPGDFDGVLGTVSNLSVTGNRFDFTVFTSNELVTITADSNTNFEGPGSLGNLANGERLLVDARLQSDGNFLAQDIIRETTSTTAQQLRGLVLARTPVVGGGDLTSLNLLVMDVIPAPTTDAQKPGEIVTVTVDALTAFRISTEDLPVATFPNLDFDRQTLRAGQLVHVVQRSGAMGFTAASITLEEISLTGTVGAVGPGSFDFIPDGDYFPNNSLGQLTVSTNVQTEFEDMPAGLGSLQPNISIVGVRGVLVFQAGNGVLVGKRVRLLGP